MQTRNLIIAVAIALLIVILTCCRPEPTPQPTPTAGPPSYEVVNETGLYPSFDSEEPVRYLAPATILIPAGDAEELACTVHIVEGISITLCHVEVRDIAGGTGWVIKKWIARR